MRIALASALFPPYAVGGAETVAAELARALQSAGHRVDVVSTCRRGEVPGNRYRVDEWGGVRVWRIAPWNLYWGFDKTQLNPSGLVRAGWHMVDLWNPSVLHPLRQVFEQIQPDIVNTHNIDGFSPVLWQAARRYTAAIVHTLHDCHLICARATMQRRDGTVCSARRCSMCRAYSTYHALFQRQVRTLISPTRALAELHRQGGWSEASIEIVPNAAEVPLPSERDLPDGGPLRVLFMSRLEREKGCEALLAAAAQFCQADGIEFHLAGSGSYAGRFGQFAATHSSVHWHGFVSGSSKHRLLASSDVFLQLSECHDNAPLSLVEARRSGLHLVGTDIGGIPELIGAPQYGQVIPPGDTRSLCSVLRALAGNVDEVRRERRRRLDAIAPYGFREMAESYARVFSSLLPGPG